MIEGEDVDFFISYSPLDEAWAVWVAWELEELGFKVMLQAWDFVPGSNFIEFMDRGVARSHAVIALLSRRYLASRYGRIEWQAAMRSNPDAPEHRLITIRIEDCEVDGLLAAITFVDLAHETDRNRARHLLRTRIQDALDGRAKPDRRPEFPPFAAAGGPSLPIQSDHPPAAAHAPHALYTPTGGADYPPEPRTATILHVTGPRFEKAHVDSGAGARFAQEITDAYWTTGRSAPDALVISGDLTDTGSLREFDQARDFAVGLRSGLKTPAHRMAVVPGSHDVTRAASLAYFTNCEADQTEPEPPYWPKWRHFDRFFRQLYEDVPAVRFADGQPWTLFTIPELRIAVAGLNSTIAESHRSADHYGWVGAHQASWFSEELTECAEDDWLRIGVLSTPPDRLRDAIRVERLLEPPRQRDDTRDVRRHRDSLHLVLHGPGDDDGPAAAAVDVDRVIGGRRPGDVYAITVHVDPAAAMVTVRGVDQISDE